MMAAADERDQDQAERPYLGRVIVLEWYVMSRLLVFET
jgi:hypothetical protein